MGKRRRRLWQEYMESVIPVCEKVPATLVERLLFYHQLFLNMGGEWASGSVCWLLLEAAEAIKQVERPTRNEMG